MRFRRLPAVFIASVGVLLALAGPARPDVKRVKGQTVYVPAYSHIYHGDRQAPFYLTVTLSVRNTDPAHTIRVLSVEYYDTDGKLIRKYLSKEMTLPPLDSTEFVVKESEKEGGAGANFLVKWEAEKEVTAPIVETVMIGTITQQGISFTSRGEPIEEH